MYLLSLLPTFVFIAQFVDYSKAAEWKDLIDPSEIEATGSFLNRGFVYYGTERDSKATGTIIERSLRDAIHTLDNRGKPVDGVSLTIGIVAVRTVVPITTALIRKPAIGVIHHWDKERMTHTMFQVLERDGVPSLPRDKNYYQVAYYSSTKLKGEDKSAAIVGVLEGPNFLLDESWFESDSDKGKAGSLLTCLFLDYSCTETKMSRSDLRTAILTADRKHMGKIRYGRSELDALKGVKIASSWNRVVSADRGLDSEPTDILIDAMFELKTNTQETVHYHVSLYKDTVKTDDIAVGIISSPISAEDVLHSEASKPLLKTTIGRRTMPEFY